MKREAERALAAWKNRSSRKPLLLRGVRQCGKTYLLKNIFGASFPVCHYFDLERDTEAASIFQNGSLEPKRLLSELEYVVNASINPRENLIIFDEIQACPRALTSLKYFNDDLPGSFICAAGSLVGVTMSDEPFPVGKVDFLDLYPMSFPEFLEGVGEDRAQKALLLAGVDLRLPDVVHSRLWELLGEYLVTGGMPEVVETFRDMRENSLWDAFHEVRDIQENLIKGYLADMAKHSGRENSMHIERVWKNLPAQLGREINGNASRYRFKGMISGRKGYRGLEGPIGWLEKTRLVIRCLITNRAEPPLSAWTNPGRFKLYTHDVGILGAIADIPLLNRGGFREGFYKGWVAENLVAQEMIAAGEQALYSWKENTAEVEFLLQQENRIYPIEVKAGRRANSKSAGVFASKYNSPCIVKLGAWNFRTRGRTHFIPLYAAGFVSPFLKAQMQQD